MGEEKLIVGVGGLFLRGLGEIDRSIEHLGRQEKNSESREFVGRTNARDGVQSGEHTTARWGRPSWQKTGLSRQPATPHLGVIFVAVDVDRRFLAQGGR